MSLVKKIAFLIVVFIGFVIFSVYNFDYESPLNNQISTTQNGQINSSDTGLIDKIIDKFVSSDKNGSEPFSMVISKKDGMIVLDGTFASVEESKTIFNMLNINRDGVYIYDENVFVDELLLSKIATIMPSFKDFFEDNAKLSVINDEVFLTGELKDHNHLALLESIISRTDLNLVKDIKIANPILIKEEESPENTLTKALTIDEIQVMINQVLTDNKIAFERKSSIITENSSSALTQIAKILKDNSKIKIEIGGHTDSRGEKALNKQISQERANSVKTALVSLGINENRLTAVGFGEDFPIAKDDANGLSEVNRRVEFNIVGE